MTEGEAKKKPVRSAYVTAALNSASGFLSRAQAARTRSQALEAIHGAEQWIARAKEAVESGEIPDGLHAELRPPGPRLPLESLDGDES